MERLENTGVSVFYPSPASAGTNLKNATLFTRINIIASPEVTKAALESTPTLQNTFCLGHLNNVLIFDNDGEEHTSHVSAVLEMLVARDLKAYIHGCAFDKASWTDAGFQFDNAGREAFMVVLREHLAPDARNGHS
ncbi:MAG: hypothetical protein Q9212_007341 [Teloschistes hypoglaucus]